MSERERAELKALLGEVFEEKVEPKLLAFEGKLSGALRRRNLALLTAILCLIAAAFSAGYALNSRTQLHDQITANATVVCATARSTALAFREPQISADGTKESNAHFLERMLAQRLTLIAAGRTDPPCESLPGFATFPFLRARALYEIDQILHELRPDRFPRPHPPAKPGSVQPGPSASTSPSSSGPTAPVAASPPSGSPAAGGGGSGSEGNGGGGGPKNTHPSNPPPSGGEHEGGGGGNEGGSTGGSEGAPGGAGGAGGTGGEGGSGGGEQGGGGEGEQGGGSSNGVVGGAGEAVGEVLCTVDKLTGLRICPQQ